MTRTLFGWDVRRHDCDDDTKRVISTNVKITFFERNVETNTARSIDFDGL